MKWRLTGLFAVLAAAHALAGDLVIKQDDFPDIAKELMVLQEQMLAATIPRPSGEAVTNDCDEIVRRMRIVIETWPDMKRGKKDAQDLIQKGELHLKAFAPLNDVERRYAKLIRSRFGVEVDDIAKPATNASDLLYIYGFNSAVADELRGKHKEAVFWAAVEEATDHQYEVADGGLFFIPWRFSFGAHSIIMKGPNNRLNLISGSSIKLPEKD